MTPTLLSMTSVAVAASSALAYAAVHNVSRDVLAPLVGGDAQGNTRAFRAEFAQRCVPVCVCVCVCV